MSFRNEFSWLPRSYRIAISRHSLAESNFFVQFCFSRWRRNMATRLVCLPESTQKMVSFKSSSLGAAEKRDKSYLGWTLLISDCRKRKLQSWTTWHAGVFELRIPASRENFGCSTSQGIFQFDGPSSPYGIYASLMALLLRIFLGCFPPLALFAKRQVRSALSPQLSVM